MPWSRSVGLIPVKQAEGNFCGPACIQMILSSLGLTQLVADNVQQRFMDFINVMDSTVPMGNPNGVAYTINRFNTSGFIAPVSPAAIKYRPARTSTPYEGCATIVDALLHHHAPSIVAVFDATHWVVIFGAEGDGTPGNGPFSVKRMLMCNPDNGYYKQVPRASRGPKPLYSGFSVEEITYASFIETYFYGAANTDDNFTIVTTSLAKSDPDLLPPYPEDAPEPVKPALQAALDARPIPGLDPLPEKAHRGKPRVVRRVDHGSLYYLIPVVLPDDAGQIVRFDAQGRYAGRLFGSAEQAARLLNDGAPVESVRVFAQTEDVTLDANELHRDDTLVWRPSDKSATPYHPFHVVTHDGGTTYLVSQEGTVVRELLDLRTRAPLTIL